MLPNTLDNKGGISINIWISKELGSNLKLEKVGITSISLLSEEHGSVSNKLS